MTEWMLRGGPLMLVLLALGLVLYALLVRLSVHALLRQPPPPGTFVIPRTLILVAPLLGLLGTVTGVIESFDALVDRGTGLGEGIGIALRTTQYGLTIAAPALLWERGLSRWARQEA